MISLRKRTLVSRANAAGLDPENVQARKADEYRELLVREQRVRARLEEIVKAADERRPVMYQGTKWNAGNTLDTMTLGWYLLICSCRFLPSWLDGSCLPIVLLRSQVYPHLR